MMIIEKNVHINVCGYATDEMTAFAVAKRLAKTDVIDESRESVVFVTVEKILDQTYHVSLQNFGKNRVIGRYAAHMLDLSNLLEKKLTVLQFLESFGYEQSDQIFSYYEVVLSDVITKDLVVDGIKNNKWTDVELQELFEVELTRCATIYAVVETVEVVNKI